MNQRLLQPVRLLLVLGIIGVLVSGLSGCSSQPDDVSIATPSNQTVDGEPIEYIDDSGNEAILVDDGENSPVATSDPNVIADATEDTPEDPPEMAESEDAGQEAMSASGEDLVPNPASTAGVAADPNQPPGSPPEPAKPKTLREQAEIAFAEGFDRTAVRLLQAHALAVPSEAAPILANYRWSRMRLQPQLLARIAVGVDLKNEYASVTKDKFAPIGSIRMQSSRGGDSDGSEDTFEDQGGGDGGSLGTVLQPTNERHRILQKYTGLLGEGLVEHMRRSHAEGLWSPVFKSNAGILSSKSTPSNRNFQEAEEEMSDEDDGSGGASPPPSPSPSSSSSTGAKDGLEAKYISLGPAMSFIGVNTAPELIERAKKGQFDALVIYDVEITINRKLRIIYNECRARLINLSDGKTAAATKLLKNTDATREMAKTGGSLIEKTMQPLLTALDSKVALAEMPPALTADIIKSKRLPMLFGDKARSQLETLSELRLYREMSLLTDAELEAAFTTLLGAEDSGKLLTGTDEERRQVVDKLLAAVSE